MKVYKIPSSFSTPPLLPPPSSLAPSSPFTSPSPLPFHRPHLPFHSSVQMPWEEEGGDANFLGPMGGLLNAGVS